MPLTGKPSLAWEFDQPSKEPGFTDKCIRFNGIGDDGHETFYVDSPEEFSFCKTARKPYDLAVCMCLLIMRDVFGSKFEYSSDGDLEDGWGAAVDALNKFAPKDKGVWQFNPHPDD